MKVFLTGASGILGTDIHSELTKLGHEVQGYNSSDIEIGNYNDVKTKVDAYRPDLIIHSAAMTNVDLCEDDKNAAILINVIGTQNLAKAADRVDSKIIYISSCGVYGDTKTTPYNELDKTIPSTYHHFTKLEGERMVKESNKNFLILRAGWLFGGSQQHRKNFVEARRKEALANTILKSAADKSGSPTYTLHFARQLIELIKADMTGTFNIANEGCASRFDYVSEIVRLFNIGSAVEPVNSNAFPRKANMPDNECLENMNLNLRKINIMPDWKAALAEYININYKA